MAQPGAPVNSQGGGPRHARFWVVASIRIVSSVNRNDVRAALKVCFDILAQKSGFLLDTRVDVLDSVAEIRERLRNRSVDLVMLAMPDYLELESSRLIVPILTDVRGAQAAAPYSYLLMVNPGSGATSVASLRGKNLLVAARSSGPAAGEWLEVLLGKEKLGRAAAFFGSIKTSDKPQSCILPLFFDAADACVVDEINLDLAREMNPQLGRLRELARSPPMIESVVALPAEPGPYQKELIDTMLSLHGDPRGRQLLMVFKTDRLVRIQPGDLDSARELWKDYARLTGPAPQSPAGPGGAPAARGNPAGSGERQ